MWKKMTLCFSARGKDWFLKLKLEARRGKSVTSFFKNQEIYSIVKLQLSSCLLDSSSSCSFSPNACPFGQLDSTELQEEKLGSLCRCQPVQPLRRSEGKREAPVSPADRQEAMWRIPHWHPLTALSWTPSWNACQVVSSKKIYVQEEESNVFPPPQQSWCLHWFWWMTYSGTTGKVRFISCLQGKGRDTAWCKQGGSPFIEKANQKPLANSQDRHVTLWTSHSFHSLPTAQSKTAQGSGCKVKNSISYITYVWSAVCSFIFSSCSQESGMRQGCCDMTTAQRAQLLAEILSVFLH